MNQHTITGYDYETDTDRQVVLTDHVTDDNAWHEVTFNGGSLIIQRHYQHPTYDMYVNEVVALPQGLWTSYVKERIGD